MLAAGFWSEAGVEYVRVAGRGMDGVCMGCGIEITMRVVCRRRLVYMVRGCVLIENEA